MQYKREHTLENALDTSIQRLMHGFDKQWLFTGTSKIDGNCIDEWIEDRKEDYHFLFEPAQHDFTEICMCITGVLAFKIGNHFVELQEGYAGFILPGLTHCEIPMKNQDYLAMWLVIRSSKARLHLSGSRNHEFFTSDITFLKSCEEYNILLNRIRYEEENPKSNIYTYEMIKTCLMQMYIIAKREVTDEVSLKGYYLPYKERIALDIKEYISRCGLSHMKLRDISQEMCISENHMNSIFKSVTGITIAQHIDRQRVDMAKRLLADSTLTITVISSRLGYYDRYHFSKVFKKATGYSPGQFRNMLSKENQK